MARGAGACAAHSNPTAQGKALPAAWRDQLLAYYRRPAVRARLLEFLGGRSAAQATAGFITTAPVTRDTPFRPLPPATLWEALDRDLELSRSLADRAGLVAHLDLEHVHFDRPWECYTRASRAFALQRPVVEAIEGLLARHGVASLHLLTGRGHHWVWRVPLASPALAALVALGAREGPRPGVRMAATAPPGQVENELLPRAHRGLGLVLEALAHRVVRSAQGSTEVPLQVTAVKAGPGPQGREILSLDLSAFGDPLGARTVRVPFSVYLKAWRLGVSREPPLALPPLVPVPVTAPGEEDLSARLPERAALLAARVSAAIPDSAAGCAALVRAYRGSPVAAFHRWYHAEAPQPEEAWPDTYDRVDPAALPPCAAQVLAQPNDLALRPAFLQHLTRVLMALDWHPRHVAGLVRSLLERDHGWVPGLHFFDAETRAEFYVRLFAGLLLLGTDPLIDLNCCSAAEKGLCPATDCAWNLADLRDGLRRGGVPWEEPAAPGEG